LSVNSGPTWHDEQPVRLLKNRAMPCFCSAVRAPLVAGLEAVEGGLGGEQGPLEGGDGLGDVGLGDPVGEDPAEALPVFGDAAELAEQCGVRLAHGGAGDGLVGLFLDAGPAAVGVDGVHVGDVPQAHGVAGHLPLAPMLRGSPSLIPFPGLWQVAQAMVLLPDRRVSKNRSLPSATLSGVWGLSAGNGHRAQHGAGAGRPGAVGAPGDGDDGDGGRQGQDDEPRPTRTHGDLSAF